MKLSRNIHHKFPILSKTTDPLGIFLLGNTGHFPQQKLAKSEAPPNQFIHNFGWISTEFCQGNTNRKFICLFVCIRAHVLLQ